LDKYIADNNQNSIVERKKENLEISSTGYGLEGVSTEKEGKPEL